MIESKTIESPAGVLNLPAINAALVDIGFNAEIVLQLNAPIANEFGRWDEISFAIFSLAFYHTENGLRMKSLQTKTFVPVYTGREKLAASVTEIYNRMKSPEDYDAFLLFSFDKFKEELTVAKADNQHDLIQFMVTNGDAV